MGFLLGLKYNLQGLWMGLKIPKLLLLGLLRFLAVLVLTIIASGLILIYHQDILNIIWTKPESQWILWLWYVVSWLLTLFLVGVSAIFSYLVAQILFSVLIMDIMSRITERLRTGTVLEPENTGFWNWSIYLIKQEIPRSIIPVMISMVIMIISWIIPLGIILAAISSGITIAFLSWDNTDLVPARRMLSFRDRFKIFSKTLLFHLGFGLPFLIPGLNILFLSFAPVGGTLYYLEKSPV